MEKYLPPEIQRTLKNFEVKERLDAGGKFIYPGFIDAHAHFVGYGMACKE